MKYIYILIAVFILSSCHGTKQVVTPTPKKEKTVEQITINNPSETSTTPVAEKEVEIEIEETLIESTREDVVEPIETTITESFNHIDWDVLLQKYVSDKGNVDYKGFKNDRKKLKIYITNLATNMPNDDWKKEEILAYWINAYNALTVDLILRNYPTKSIKDIKDPWEQRLWKLGTKWYNLNQIEHKILRKMNEPRIHFGIVCASYSCPKLSNKAYTANDLEVQLTRATKDFLKDPERNNISEKTIKLSKIFKWFAKDFKTNGPLIDFLNKYTDITICKSAKKTYKDYNWDLNE